MDERPVWEGRQAIRISVSNWQTTADDIDRTVAQFADGSSGISATTR